MNRPHVIVIISLVGALFVACTPQSEAQSTDGVVGSTGAADAASTGGAGSTSTQPTSSSMPDDGTSLDPDASTTASDDGSSGGLTDGDTGGASTDSDGATSSCTHDCRPDEPSTCSLDSTTATACVDGPDGCFAWVDEPCDQGVCVQGVGCVVMLPPSCAGIQADDPTATDGTYTIDPDGIGGLEEFDVYCDMTSSGGGWTLIASNDQPTAFTNFNQDWAAYRDGFGDVDVDQRGWLGNDRIHALSVGGVELDVRHDDGTHRYANFTVADEASLYELTFSSTPASADGGAFAGLHNGRPFSNFDSDNDTHADNCAVNFSAGWWYAACYTVSLAAGNASGGAYWQNASGQPDFVAWIEMWVR